MAHIMNDELHVAGILVHTKPDALPYVSSIIAAMPGSEVHATSLDGKLVVTVESVDSAVILDRLDAMNRIQDVISAALVYQHNEPLDRIDEEMS